MKRLVVVIFDGTPLGIMSFAFGVFDLAKHYDARTRRGRCLMRCARRMPPARA